MVGSAGKFWGGGFYVGFYWVGFCGFYFLRRFLLYKFGWNFQGWFLRVGYQGRLFLAEFSCLVLNSTASSMQTISSS